MSKGKQLLDEAEKKLKASGSGMTKLFGSSSSKVDEAAELFAKAGNAFKMDKEWSAAGSAFCKAADVYAKQQTKHEAANMFNEAATAYKKDNPPEALACLNKACEIYIDMGRIAQAAKQYKDIAEFYESESVGDLPQACTYYEKAADLFKTEENKSSARACLEKVAYLSATHENYKRAIEIFEKIGTESLDQAVQKYRAGDFFFRAGLCHLCVDHLNCQQALQRYEGIMVAFADSRECKFLKKLINAVDEQSAEAFTNAVKEHDQISRLDNWSHTLLQRIKKPLTDENDLK